MSFWEVTLNGFRCNTQTTDHMFNVDGWGDEVFFGTTVTVANKAGNQLSPTNSSRSKTHGDTSGYYGRVRAGTGKSSGGIITGNWYPDDPAHRNGSLYGDELPMLLYRGILSEDTVIGVTPTIWEWDGGQDAFTTFTSLLKQHGPTISKAVADVVATINPSAGQIVTPVVTVINDALPALVAFLNGIFGMAGDRPIGTQQDNNGARSFVPQTLVLNEAIASRLAATDFGHGPGVLEISYTDSPNIGGGSYSLFVECRCVGNELSDGAMIRPSSRPEVYIVFGGAKFWIPTPEILERYGSWDDVIILPDAVADSIPTNMPRNGTILREMSDPRVWLIENGLKRRFATPEALMPYGGWAVVRVIPDGALVSMPEGEWVSPPVAAVA